MRLYFAAICAALLFLTQAESGWGQSPAAPLPPPAITILPVPGLTLVDTNTFRYDASIVDCVRTPRLERAFTLENDTKQPLTIAKLRGSCGCETLLLRKGGTQVSSTLLKPGEQAACQLTVQLHSGQTGPVRKYVWIDGLPLAGQASLLATLQVDLTLRQSVSFSPSYLDFGKVESGAGASRPLTVLVDADLVTGQSLPPLGSLNPDVRVHPVGSAQYIREGETKRLKQIYQIILSANAHAGRVTGELHFAPPPAPGGSALLASVAASVAGRVNGTLDAMPASVFFGSLPAGKPVTRSLVLSTSTPEIAGSLSVSSRAPWLRADLGPADPSARHRLLTLTLTDQAPVGSMQEKVTVTAPGGDHLDIPVIAELTK